MQKNQNNVEIKSQNNIKYLIQTFETDKKSLTDNQKNTEQINKRLSYKIENKNNQLIKNPDNNLKNEKEEKVDKNKENKEKEILVEDEKNLNEKLLNIKIKTLSLLGNSLKDISKKYQNFSDSLINWFKIENQKISKLFKEKKQKINWFQIKLYDKIKKIFQILETLVSSVHDQLALYDLFLSDNFFDLNFPLEEFMLKNCDLIINGNFLSKIDIKSVYLNKIFENKDLTEIFQKYYLKKGNDLSEIKCIKIKTIDDLNSINNKFHESKNEENNFLNEVNSLYFKNLNLSSFPIEKIEISNLNNLEKFKIKKCVNLYNTNIYKSIINSSSNLKIIELKNIQLTDKSFNEFFQEIIKINSLLKSIKYLSFSHNNLCSINLKINKSIFENLEMLDFSNNNIYYFANNNFKIFPKLKILDLSNNNFNNNLLFKGIYKNTKNKLINFIVFMSQNIFLYNVNDNNQKYIKYLNDNLPGLDYDLKKINLCFVYNQYTLGSISKLLFSPALKKSLVKLNLSFCGLNDLFLWKFFSNNYDLINLKKLNLSNNFISFQFFSFLEDLNYLTIMDKLEKIDLSFNSLKCEKKDDIEKLNLFLENYQYLKVLKLQNNHILNIFKKNTVIIQYKDEINNLINLCEKRHIQIQVQNDIISYIDNEKFKKIFIYKNKL